ncbi:hypothetical protein Tco_0674909 [Tanacetum coccineum]
MKLSSLTMKNTSNVRDVCKQWQVNIKLGRIMAVYWMIGMLNSSGWKQMANILSLKQSIKDCFLSLLMLLSEKLGFIVRRLYYWFLEGFWWNTSLDDAQFLSLSNSACEDIAASV